MAKQGDGADIVISFQTGDIQIKDLLQTGAAVSCKQYLGSKLLCGRHWIFYLSIKNVTI